MSTIPIIDPSGSFALSAKYKKALEKGKLAGIRLEFDTSGVRVLAALPSKEGEQAQWVPIAEAMASISGVTEERPFEDEKAHIVGKFEVRLDKECPVALRDSASKEALTAAIQGLPFKERRALQMSNREFELAYLRWEDGTPVPRPAEQAELLRQEQAANRGRANARGRGRGGRGRGSFRSEENPPKESAQAPKSAQ